MRFVFFLACLPICAADIAVLQSGARLSADRIERTATQYILHTAGGRIELPSDAVDSIEHFEDPITAPVAMPTVIAAAPQLTPHQLIDEAALRHGLPPAIVHALALTESAYQQKAVSPKGAVGVMQLMPATALALHADPHDVAENIDAGTRLLRELLLKYQNGPNPVRRALAAYNAGEGAVQRYHGVPPYRETQMYVEKVIQRYFQQPGTR